jgi:hypothetical protein
MEDVLAYASCSAKISTSFQQADNPCHVAMTGAAAMEIGGVTTASNSTTCETKPMLAG